MVWPAVCPPFRTNKEDKRTLRRIKIVRRTAILCRRSYECQTKKMVKKALFFSLVPVKVTNSSRDRHAETRPESRRDIQYGDLQHFTLSSGFVTLASLRVGRTSGWGPRSRRLSKNMSRQRGPLIVSGSARVTKKGTGIGGSTTT